jgi:hypothetical protein
VAVSAETGEWTEDQELALVAALKQFGKELSDRWVGEGLAACLTFLRRSKIE